jgi:hypothetical protein
LFSVPSPANQSCCLTQLPRPHTYMELADLKRRALPYLGPAPTTTQGLRLRPPTVSVLFHRQHPAVRVHHGQRRDGILARLARPGQLPRADHRDRTSAGRRVRPSR